MSNDIQKARGSIINLMHEYFSSEITMKFVPSFIFLLSEKDTSSGLMQNFGMH